MTNTNETITAWSHIQNSSTGLDWAVFYVPVNTA